MRTPGIGDAAGQALAAASAQAEVAALHATHARRCLDVDTGAAVERIDRARVALCRAQAGGDQAGASAAAERAADARRRAVRAGVLDVDAAAREARVRLATTAELQQRRRQLVRDIDRLCRRRPAGRDRAVTRAQATTRAANLGRWQQVIDGRREALAEVEIELSRRGVP